MLKEAIEEHELASMECLIKTQCNRRQYDSWPQEDNFIIEMILTGRIRNSLYLPDQLNQVIPTGRPRPRV